MMHNRIFYILLKQSVYAIVVVASIAGQRIVADQQECSTFAKVYYSALISKFLKRSFVEFILVLGLSRNNQKP